MSDLTAGIMGVLIYILGASIAIWSAWDDIKAGIDANQLIETCQQALPRNKYCTIKAVVAEETQ